MISSVKIQYLLNRLGLTKQDIVPFAIFLAITSIVFLISYLLSVNLTGVFLYFLLFYFSIIVLMFWFIAGVAVFRSLVVASVSLSVVIFLTQSYCSLPEVSRTADDALKSLFGFGIIYSAFLFVSSLKDELFGDKEKKWSLKHLTEGKNPKDRWIILVPYAVFIGLFLWQFYQVANPIINNLCIYKSEVISSKSL